MSTPIIIIIGGPRPNSIDPGHLWFASNEEAVAYLSGPSEDVSEQAE